ncbi:MAG: CBS domain-containing protein [Brevinema sp.]
MEDGYSEQERIHFLGVLAHFKAEDVLTPISQTELFELDATWETVLATVKETGFSRFPVYDEGIDDIVGILHIRSLLFASQENFSLREYLNKPLVISENKKLDELFKEFNQHKTHFAIVVDEHGSVRGIITMEDILESVLGGIEGEFDPSEENYTAQRHGQGVYSVDPRMELEDFNTQFRTAFNSDDCDTIGGYIMQQLGRVPSEGETWEEESYKIQVTKAQGPKLIELSVHKK